MPTNSKPSAKSIELLVGAQEIVPERGFTNRAVVLGVDGLGAHLDLVPRPTEKVTSLAVLA